MGLSFSPLSRAFLRGSVLSPYLCQYCLLTLLQQMYHDLHLLAVSKHVRAHNSELWLVHQMHLHYHESWKSSLQRLIFMGIDINVAMITQAHPSSPYFSYHLRLVYRRLSSCMQLLYHHSTYISMGYVIYHQIYIIKQ